MAPPFTLKLGALDLAPYVRVGNDEGFDPYDGGGFEEPAFIDNPFGEGQGLANVDSRNREMSWPLYLNSTTKDGLHTLIRQINQEIRYAARPLRVEWRDQDATNSTYYDVEFARFDPNFKMRPSAQKWLAGVLRVWTKPYGHTATWRTIGTAGPSSSIPSFAAASTAGDIEGELRFTFSASVAATLVGAEYPRIVTVQSSLPTGWVPVFPIASVNRITATIVGASGALGSQVLRTFPEGAFTYPYTVSVPVPSTGEPIAGRLLVPARVTTATGVALAVYRDDISGVAVGANAYLPTAVLTPTSANSWRLVDLGVLQMNAQRPATVYLTLQVGAYPSANATRLMDLGPLLFVPEDSTSYTNDALGTDHDMATTTILSDGSGQRDQVRPSSALSQVVRVRAQGSIERGRTPLLSPGAGESVFAFRMIEGPFAQNQPYRVDVAVRERFTFAR